MSYMLDWSLSLGTGKAGLSDLRAQLVDTAGGAVGAAVSTGFTEIGSGCYLWHVTAIPDGHRGGVKFFSAASPAAVLAFGAINPEEAERVDAAVSSRSTYAGTSQTADVATLIATVGTAGAGLTALGDTRLANLDATITSRHAAGAAVAKSPATLAAADVSGNLPANLAAILGTALTESGAGYLAAALIKLLDVAVPALVASEAMRGTDGAYTGTPPSAADIADAVLDEAKGAHTGHIASIPTNPYTGTPPTTSDIKTALEADGSKLDHLWEMTEDDGGVRRLTANALEQAPTGGVALTAQEVRDAMKLAPTSGVPAVGSVDAHLDDVLADTNELQTDLVDGGRLDLLIDAIKAKTDNLPSDPADESLLEAAITAATSPLATAANLATVDGVVDAILVDTGTTLPAAIADVPTVAELGTALAAADDAVLAAIADVPTVAEFEARTLPSADYTVVSDLPAAPDNASIAAILEDTGTTLPTAISEIAPQASVAISATQAEQVADGELAIATHSDFSQSITSDLAADLSTAEVWLAVKHRDSDDDTEALVMLTAADGLTVLAGSAYATGTDGALTVTGSTGDWTVTAELEAVATALLTSYAGRHLVAEVKYRLTGGQVRVLWSGTAAISRGVIHRTV